MKIPFIKEIKRITTKTATSQKTKAVVPNQRMKERQDEYKKRLRSKISSRQRGDYG